MIQVDGLTLAYDGEYLFENASFTIQPKEKCALVGRNGTGKSSLFRILTGREIPDRGTISRKKNYLIGMLDQHIKFTKPTLLEEAATGLRPGEEDCLYKAETILFGLGFTEADLDGTWQLYGPKEGGCELCNNGYKGRVGIYQVMPITDAISRIIMKSGTAHDIADQAKIEGVKDLRQSGLIKVMQGLTSVEEVEACTNE